MARNYILGGMGATQLQAGKPYFKRIIRIDGSLGGTTGEGGALRSLTSPEAPGRDGLTCKITDGKIRFDLNNGKSKAWAAGVNHDGGELLMVEFPTTLRSVQIQMEEGTVGVRAKVMLTAPNQETKADGTTQIAQPIENGNFIEIKSGDTATISSRTKVVFILIQKYDDTVDAIFKDVENELGEITSTALTGAGTGLVTDAVSILVTGVLDHEPTSGGSQAANEPNSTIVPDTGPERELRKIWGKGDGVG